MTQLGVERRTIGQLFQEPNGRVPRVYLLPEREQFALESDDVHKFWSGYAPRYPGLWIAMGQFREPLADYIPSLQKGIALDLFCGDGAMTVRLLEKTHPKVLVGAVDYSVEMLNGMANRIASNREDGDRVIGLQKDLSKGLNSRDDISIPKESIAFAMVSWGACYLSMEQQARLFRELFSVMEDGTSVAVSTFVKNSAGENPNFGRMVGDVIARTQVKGEYTPEQLEAFLAAGKYSAEGFGRFTPQGRFYNPRREEIESWCEQAGFRVKVAKSFDYIGLGGEKLLDGFALHTVIEKPGLRLRKAA